MGALRLRWHNSGGLADVEQRRKYLRRLMQDTDIAGICETSWKDDATASCAQALARWDPRIQAELLVGGQYERTSGSGRNAGMALLIKKGVADGARVRDHGDDTLQCLVVDMKVRELSFRIVLTHGDPSADIRVKMAHYTRLFRAAARIN